MDTSKLLSAQKSPNTFFFSACNSPPQKSVGISPPRSKATAANGNSSEISFLQSANQAETKAEKPRWNNPAGAHRDAESCLDVRRALTQHTSIKQQLLLRAVAAYLGEKTPPSFVNPQKPRQLRNMASCCWLLERKKPCFF